LINNSAADNEFLLEFLEFEFQEFHEFMQINTVTVIV